MQRQPLRPGPEEGRRPSRARGRAEAPATGSGGEPLPQAPRTPGRRPATDSWARAAPAPGAAASRGVTPPPRGGSRRRRRQGPGRAAAAGARAAERGAAAVTRRRGGGARCGAEQAGSYRAGQTAPWPPALRAQTRVSPVGCRFPCAPLPASRRARSGRGADTSVEGHAACLRKAVPVRIQEPDLLGHGD